MKKKLIASFLMVSMIFTNLPQTLWGVFAAEETIPDDGQGDRTERISAPETTDAIVRIEELYEDINLKNAEKKEFGTKTLIVKTGVQAFDAFGAAQMIQIDGGTYVLSYEDRKSAENAYQKYSSADWVDFVEPDSVVELEDTGSTENGTETMETESPAESVQSDTETERPAESMQSDTETERPAESVQSKTEEKPLEDAVKTAACLAVIDTGICASAGEAGSYMDDGREASDENGHGTQVANLIADVLAQAGLTKEQVRLLPVKVADADGRCTVLQLYLGILSAIEQGADLLNISLGTKNAAASSLLEQAMQEAYAGGIIVVTSAGNDGADVTGYAPANIPSVITVGSVDKKKKQSAFSNYGQTMDCVSYGENITVTDLGGEKRKEEGTSYAAANVTAELAVQMAIGTVHSPDEADAYIKNCAEDLGVAGWDEIYGYGLLGSYPYPEESGKDTEAGSGETEEAEAGETGTEETEEPGSGETEAEEPENTEVPEALPSFDSEYLQKVNTYNLLIGDIEILAANDNLESTKLLADTMKKSIGELIANHADIHAAFDEEAMGGMIAGRRYAGTGNAEIDEAALELEGYLKECAFAEKISGEDAAGFEEKLDGFVEFLAGFQGSEPLARDVSIEATTTKTVGDAATLQSIAQTAGDFTVKLKNGITLTSEIVVTNGCTLRLQSNAESTRRTISFGTLPGSAKTSGMCMFRVVGLKSNQLIIGKADGKYPVTLDGKSQPHNGFLIYNSQWSGNVSAYKSTVKIYAGTILKNNIMYYDSANPVNGASGSAICNYGTLYLYGGTIQNNGFQGKGGASVGEGGGIANYYKFYMSGGEIKGNVATNGNGILTGKMGDVAALSGYEMKITGGSIHDNGNSANKKYTSNGGGILINPNTPVSIGGDSIDSVKIYGNMADYGGGIANYGTCSLGKCKIYENYSESEGGGILNRARANTAAAPALNISGAYVYKNYCSKTDSSYAGGIASLKRRVGNTDIVPAITISSGYFYDNDGFSIHIDSGTLSFGANARFGFSSYSNAASYKVTKEWYGSGICNTGGTVSVTGSARMFVPAGATGIKNTGTLNIGDGADFLILCQGAESAIQNTGKLACGKIAKNSSGSVLYPYTIDGSASYGIKNTGSGTAYLVGRIRGNYTIGNTARSEDGSEDNRNIGTGIYNSSSASYSSAFPYAAILHGTDIGGELYRGSVLYAETGIYNNTDSGSVCVKQGGVAYCSGNGISNKGKAYIQDADTRMHDNGADGIHNYAKAELTVSSACSFYGNGSRGIYNDGTAVISAGAKIYKNTANGVTNHNNGMMTVSGAADIYGNGGDGIRNYKTMTISGNAKIHGNTGHGLENDGSTTLSGNFDIYENKKAGISNSAGHTVTMSKGTVQKNGQRGVVNGGTFNLSGGTVKENAGTTGAGIYNKEGAVLHISGGGISGNGGSASGAGVYNFGTADMSGGSITGNSAGTYGGGVMNKSGAVFTMTGGVISANRCEQDTEDDVKGHGGGIYNEAAGEKTAGIIRLNGGMLYGNNAYGVHNLGTCEISGIKIGFGSFTSNAAYATSQNTDGGIANYGTLRLISGGYVNGGSAPAVVNAGTMNADAGAATILMSVSGETVLSNSGKLDTAYEAGKTSLWVISGGCRYGIKNTGSMKFSGKADGRYKVAATGYSYQESSRGFTEAAVYSSSTATFSSSYPYAAYIYGGALLAGSGKDGLRADKGTVRMDAVSDTSNKNGVNVGSSAALQMQSTDAKIYANEVGIYNNGTVQMGNANIYSNTEHGVYQNGTFSMSGTAKVNVNNDVCMPAGHVITVNGALTTDGIVAKVTPLNAEGIALEKITCREDEDVNGIACKVVTTSYAGSKGSDALFYGAKGCRFTLSNGGILRPGDYMDREILARENHAEVSDKDIVISSRYTVAYEKNIDEKDDNGNPVDVAVADMPENQSKFWCENLPLPGQEGSYVNPSVSTEPYSLYYRFLNWNDKADGNGGTIILPAVYRENEDRTIYALWQKLFNAAYIGNGQSAGDNFTRQDISQESAYTFDDNLEPDGKEHFMKDIENSYTDKETGEEVKQETTATVVQWSFDKEASIGEQNYDRGSEVSASSFYTSANELNQQKGGVITSGAPNADYGPFTQLPSAQPFVNLYAVWDEGPVIEAYDLYYTLEEAQNTTDTSGITMEELLSRAGAADKEDGILAHGKDVSAGAGKKTTFIVSDYRADKFSSLTEEGTVTVNYQAVDTVGNLTDKIVTVHLIDTGAKKVDMGKVRFISEKYLDTLPEDSVWTVDSEYYDELTAVLANHRENTETYTEQAFGKNVTMEKPGTGTWAAEPEETWVFTHEQVKAVKDYVDASGIGNSKGAGALGGFLTQFASCRE